MTYQSKSERYIKYSEMLFSNGFSEAKQKDGRFFLRTMDQVAFVINLEEDEEGCMTILYGFASTAYMVGDEEWFVNHGSDMDDCQVRNILCIWDGESEINARTSISEFYEQYKDYCKEKILSVKKERQKEFLSCFARALKPLGFKKKGARWTRVLDNGRALTFDAQKSAFSDQYYFNVTVHDVSNLYAIHSYERVVTHGSAIYNWQLMTSEQIDNLIQYTLKKYIDPKIN